MNISRFNRKSINGVKTPWRHRRGVSFLESQVAMVVMAISISGLAPLMVLNTRQAAELQHQIPSTPMYLTPETGWKAKLGGAASISDEATLPVVEVLDIDDGDVGFRNRGMFWYLYTGRPSVHDADFRLFYRRGAAYGEYTLDVTPGIYEVYASYSAYSFLSDAVRYRAYDDDAETLVVVIDQRQQPNDLVENGVSWKLLGAMTCESGTARVRVDSLANRSLTMADGIQLKPVLNTLTVDDLTKDRITNSVTARISVAP